MVKSCWQWFGHSSCWELTNNRTISFSAGKKVAEGRMKGDLKLWKFITFSVLTIPSPTVYDSPPSPSWARVFIELISFTNLIFWVEAISWFFVFSFGKKVAEGRMRDVCQLWRFLQILSDNQPICLFNSLPTSISNVSKLSETPINWFLKNLSAKMESLIPK